MKHLPPVPVYMENRVYSRVRSPPGGVEYVGSQGIEERHAQIDDDFLKFNLMAFWLRKMHLKLGGMGGVANSGVWPTH